MSGAKKVFAKNPLGNGFWLIREDDKHWIGYETKENGRSRIQLVKITKDAYVEILKGCVKGSGDR